MRTITTLEAHDGSRWDTVAECALAGAVYKISADILAGLPEVPSESTKRIAVPEGVRDEAWKQAVKLCKTRFQLPPNIMEADAKDINPIGTFDK